MLIIALVFAIAAGAKLASIPRTRGLLLEIVPFPTLGWATGASVALPVLELSLAIWLVSSASLQLRAMTALIVLALFSVLLIYIHAANLPIQSCDCFGDLLPSGFQSNRISLSRNGVLMSMAAVALLAPISPDDVLLDSRFAIGIVLAAAIAVWVLLRLTALIGGG